MKGMIESTKRLLKDTRGASEFTQMIILVVAVALAGLAFYRPFTNTIGQKLQTVGQAILGI